MIIKNITARKILASLGDETVEATINDRYSASVPAGISAGKYEIKKVKADEAVEEVQKINEICKNKDWTQESLDKEISSHGFGGNSTLAVSAAFYKIGLPLDRHTGMQPKLFLLLFEGGEHGNKNITMQEFCIIENNVSQAVEDFAKVKNYLKQNNIETTVGAEGGFSPLAFDNNKAIATIKQLFPDKQIGIDMADCFGNAAVPEGVFSVEDPFNDEDWSNWTNLNNLQKYLVIGDDLTVTNPERIQKAIDLKAVGGVVIKPNQIGTISQAKQAAKLCKDNNLKIVVSHRGQETNDNWIVDFALDVEADFVKFGGLDRGERIAKYNRLLEIQAGVQH
jgi:enolase